VALHCGRVGGCSIQQLAATEALVTILDAAESRSSYRATTTVEGTIERKEPTWFAGSSLPLTDFPA
jgi:hypothetical protein